MAAPVRVALLHSVVSDYGNEGQQVSNLRPFEIEGEDSFLGLYWKLEEPLGLYSSGSRLEIVRLEEQKPGHWSAIAQTETAEGLEALVRFYVEEIERPDRLEPYCYRFEARVYLDLEALDLEFSG